MIKKKVDAIMKNISMDEFCKELSDLLKKFEATIVSTEGAIKIIFPKIERYKDGKIERVYSEKSSKDMWMTGKDANGIFYYEHNLGWGYFDNMEKGIK